LGGVSVDGAGATGFGFTTAGIAASAAFFAASRAASFASCLAARSFAFGVDRFGRRAVNQCGQAKEGASASRRAVSARAVTSYTGTQKMRHF
jgi:hypothetical protein